MCLALAGAGCASAARAPVDVPAGRVATRDEEVARDVGRLLSGEPTAAREAEARLLALDADGRAALGRHAAAVPSERDPRFLHVLDAHGLLPPLAPADDVALRVAQATRDDPGARARGLAGLEARARTDPAALRARLRPGAVGSEALALGLGAAGDRGAGPALLELYVRAVRGSERRAAAAALGKLLAPRRGPDPDAVGAELSREAARVEAAWRPDAGAAGRGGPPEGREDEHGAP